MRVEDTIGKADGVVWTAAGKQAADCFVGIENAFPDPLRNLIGNDTTKGCAIPVPKPTPRVSIFRLRRPDGQSYRHWLQTLCFDTPRSE